MAIVAYSPIARGNARSDEVLRRIGAVHKKTAAQACLRFLVQLEQFVAPADIFSDYAYLSSYAASWVEHARVYAQSMQLNDLTQDGIECSVCDTGRGVPPEVLSKIFDAFFSTKADGMGIGLNLCRSIIESHQGRLHAENLYNGNDVGDPASDAPRGAISGCRFSFWLPLDSSLHPIPKASL